MHDVDLQRVEAIFAAVSALPAADRAAEMDRLCDGSADLRREVESLLGFHDATHAGGLDRSPLLSLSAAAVHGLADDHVLPPKVSAGGYTLISVLGAGGMGVVYTAEQHRPRRTVAVKVIRRIAAQSEMLRRFEHEAEALARLQHPGIAQIFEAGVADFGRGPQPFIAMELVRGIELVRAAREGNYPVRRRLEVMACVCDAVQHAHQRGVIHRDLKPANILVVADDARGDGSQSDVHDGAFSADSRIHSTSDPRGIPQPKILDFGVARVTDGDVHATMMHTGVGQLIGTLPYMSPEQVQGDPREIDTRSDVYSLGVILYELLADRLPHDVSSRSIPEAARVIREESPTRLSAISPLFRGDIDTIVSKALEKDPGRRYQSAAELAADIRRYLCDEPIVARRSSALYQFRKFAERNKRLVAAVAIGLLLVLGTAVVSAIFGVQATVARRTAQAAQSDAEARGRAAVAEAAKARWAAYLANIAAAQSSIRANDLFVGRRRLDAADPQRRNTFEWRYLQARLDDSTALLTGPERSTAMALSRDGRLLASGGGRGRVFIWNVQARHANLSLPHDETIVALAFTPDGASIASAGADSMVRFWNVSTGSLLRVLQVNSARTRYLTFSDDGRWMLLTALDTPPQLWDLKSERLAQEFASDDVPTAATISPDGRFYAAAHRDRTVRIIDLEDPGREAIVLPHSTVVQSLEFDAAGRRLLACGSDHGMYLWDVPGARLERVFRGHQDAVCSGQFSASGNELLSGSYDGTLRLWSAQTGDQLGVLRGPGGSFVRAAADVDLRIIATLSADNQVRLWDGDVARNGTVVNTGSRNLVTALAFSPDGHRFASGSGDGMVRVWNSDTATLIAEFDNHNDVVQGLAFWPDGQRLISSSFDHTACVWDLRSGALVAALAGHAASVFGVAVTPAGDLVATACEDSKIRLWDGQSLALRATLEGHRGAVRWVAFSPDGHLLASAGADATVRLWDVRTGEPRGSLRGHLTAVNAVTFNPAGTLLASTSDDRTARLWDVESRTAFGSPLAHAQGVTGCTFSPDGTRLATGCSDAAVHLWNVETVEEVIVLREHKYPLICVAFAPDGSRLISGSLDRWIRMWETTPVAARAAARTQLAQLAPRAAELVDAAMASHDGDAVAAAAMIRDDQALEAALCRAALDELLRRGAQRERSVTSPHASGSSRGDTGAGVSQRRLRRHDPPHA